MQALDLKRRWAIVGEADGGWLIGAHAMHLSRAGPLRHI
jgi:hypothetical protein